MKYRTESDTLGTVRVPAEKYWGAQTQRCLENFRIGSQKMPSEIIHAFAIVKKAAALANNRLEVLTDEKTELICEVCDEIISGKHKDQFPLPVWQTGSGTHTNMNVNEVIANRAHEIAGGKLIDSEKILHPNDDVNKSQSSNDTFSTAMNLAAFTLLKNRTMPAIYGLIDLLQEKSEQFQNIIKTGRTHLMDAAPLTLGQEFSAYVAQLKFAMKTIENSLEHLTELAIGGTAVGTGLNAPNGFDKTCVAEISIQTGITFSPAKNKFEALAANDAIVESHSALKQTAVVINKIANDLRLMASGPRCGLYEISIPTNEPGSSIMPGKINPTQIEAATMVCMQVIANDLAITTGGMSGQFQLNVYKPLIIKNFIESAQLLADVCDSFGKNCIKGILPNKKQIDIYLNNSLMLVTALNNHIGYEKSAAVAKKAFKENISLKESCINFGYLSENEFDNIVNPSKMI